MEADRNRRGVAERSAVKLGGLSTNHNTNQLELRTRRNREIDPAWPRRNYRTGKTEPAEALPGTRTAHPASVGDSAKIKTERRRRTPLRYPVVAEVTYRFLERGMTHWEGLGRSVDISRSQVLIAVDHPLPVDALVELLIAWPAKLDHRVALSLYVKGRTLTSTANHTAVAILGHEFRTRRDIQTNSQAADSRLNQNVQIAVGSSGR